MKPARFAVGIDLGTTNTVVAFSSLDGGDARVFPLPQLVGPAELEARPLLSSALWAPPAGDRTEDPFGDAPWVIGEHARRRGAEVAGRLVASHKSWLVHAGIDRSAAVLPWGAAEDVPKLSPIDAAARVLLHVRRAWDAAHPDDPFGDQDVVLTVPASFDEVARELTVEAAYRAGLAPRLLEEPQAAFYDWMARAGREGLARLLASTGGEAGGEALVLVVDVGGGTTDLSLVRVSSARREAERTHGEQSGIDRVARVAVGSHLLLGGDNMDLALAHVLEPRLAPGDDGKLDAARFAQLAAACRDAKERLLGDAPPDDVGVAVAGPGARLVGGARSVRLSREEAERVVLDGFLPAVDAGARPRRARGALVAFGLPYERDVAITRHVAAFLARHLPPGTWPDAVLFNGGVFRAVRIAERVLSSLGAWRGGEPIARLPDADPDLAVARGAVAYGLARLGRGVRIGGGSARGYFVAVDPGERGARAVCVVPRGAEDGATYAAGARAFALAVGRPVRFDVLASDEVDAEAGQVVDVDEDRFERMPPLATVLDAAGGGELRVGVQGELTPVGTLDLACVELPAGPSEGRERAHARAEGAAAPRRFRLAFQLRPVAEERAAASPSRPPPPLQAPSRIDAARELLDRAFGKPRPGASGREAKDLLRELEKALGERGGWTTETHRALFDALLPDARSRRRSADHERVFWLLAGWCVRPGFGDALDARRVAGLFALFEERLAFPAEARGWQQFWIAWRRAAGGLDQGAQTRLRDFVDPYLAPPEAGLRRPKKPALSLDDALDAASSLERVDPARRAQLGGWLLERTWTDRDPRLWAALGRLGARVPAYASAHHVVPPHVAERWLDHLLREKWDAVPTAAQAAVQLARRTGDRARDVCDRVRREVEQRLIAAGADEQAVRAVREVVEVAESERAAFFGDTLPLGLRLIG